VPLESDDNGKVVLVTDGQLPLRQCLLPETCTKNISDIPAVFCLFYDLRKEFRKCFPTATDVNSVQDIVNCKLLNFLSISAVFV
jgi:epithelial splicing regulatory protein 1/2